MKIKASVIAVADVGGELDVKLQGDEVATASWRSMTPIAFRVADIARNRKTFQIGRSLEIEIRPL